MAQEIDDQTGVESDTDNDGVESLDEFGTDDSGGDQDEEGNTEAQENNDPSDLEWLNLNSSDKTIPLSSHISKRKKLQAKLASAEDENEKLRSLVNQMGQKDGRQSSTFTESNRPVKRPDQNDYPTWSEFVAAEDAYLDNVVSQKLESRQNDIQARAQEDSYKETLSKKLDEHYGNAAGFIEKYEIPDEIYHNADHAIRSTVDSVFPGHGDHLTDRLIAHSGGHPNSAQAFLKIGRDQEALATLKKLLQEDGSGLSAATFIGSVVGSFERMEQSTTSKSKAKKPAPEHSGSIPANAGKKEKAYLKALNSNDNSRAWEIRSDARKSGVDTSNW